MAIWPPDGPRLTGSEKPDEGEKRVYDQLTSLPKDWSVWHSLWTLSPREAEADFVVGAPDAGFVVIEVKRSLANLKYSSPHEQVRRARDILCSRLKQDGLDVPESDYLVVLPMLPDGLRPYELDRTLTFDQIHRLRDLVRERMQSLRAQGKPGDDKWMWGLHSLWERVWCRPFRDGRKVPWTKLSVDQVRVLETGEKKKLRVLVAGEAGSGKTTVGYKIAEIMAKNEKRVLLLCFTNAVALSLRKKVMSSKVQAHVQVDTVGQLAKSLLAKSGVELPPEDDPQFWENLPKLAAERAKDEIAKSAWQVVIVDEGQDLSAENWILVRQLIAGAEKVFIFYDPAQTFWTGRWNPFESWPKRRLVESHRCDKPIQRLAELYGDRTGTADGISGDKVVIISCPTPSSVEEAIAREIDRLLQQHLSRKDIALISVVGRHEVGSAAVSDRVGEHRVVRADAADAGLEVVWDSFLRFRGLERPAVIVTNLRLLTGDLRKNRYTRMYISISRARHFIRIIDTAESMLGDPVLHLVDPTCRA